jgi:hypothetical protein
MLATSVAVGRHKTCPYILRQIIFYVSNLFDHINHFLAKPRSLCARVAGAAQIYSASAQPSQKLRKLAQALRNCRRLCTNLHSFCELCADTVQTYAASAKPCTMSAKPCTVSAKPYTVSAQTCTVSAKPCTDSAQTCTDSAKACTEPAQFSQALCKVARKLCKPHFCSLIPNPFVFRVRSVRQFCTRSVNVCINPRIF